MEKLIRLRNSVRVFGIAAFTIVALSLGAGAAKAQISVTGGNGQTGPNSLNQNDWNINHDVSIDVDNHSTSTDSQSFAVDTGHTFVDHNTMVGDITSGNVWGDISVDNNLNSGDILLTNTDPGNIFFTFGNGITGPDSLNQNTATISVNRSVDINNSATISNSLGLSAVTGGNRISNNTEVGNVRTGSVNFDVNQQNNANTGMGDLNLIGVNPLDVSGSFINNITGPQSSNVNSLNLDANSSVNVDNTSNIHNSVSVSADTGGNSIGNNTVVGDVSTGNVHIGVSTINSAN